MAVGKRAPPWGASVDEYRGRVHRPLHTAVLSVIYWCLVTVKSPAVKYNPSQCDITAVWCDNPGDWATHREVVRTWEAPSGVKSYSSLAFTISFLGGDI